MGRLGVGIDALHLFADIETSVEAEGEFPGQFLGEVDGVPAAPSAVLKPRLAVLLGEIENVGTSTQVGASPKGGLHVGPEHPATAVEKVAIGRDGEAVLVKPQLSDLVVAERMADATHPGSLGRDVVVLQLQVVVARAVQPRVAIAQGVGVSFLGGVEVVDARAVDVG